MTAEAAPEAPVAFVEASVKTASFKALQVDPTRVRAFTVVVRFNVTGALYATACGETMPEP